MSLDHDRSQILVVCLVRVPNGTDVSVPVYVISRGENCQGLCGLG